MGFGSWLKDKAQGVGRIFGKAKDATKKAARFIGTSGRGALRKVGEGVQTLRSIGNAVDSATGGLAGTLWSASESLPGMGAVTRNVDKGLSMATKATTKGLKAIDTGERVATAVKSAARGS